MDEVIDISFIIPCHNLENYISPLLLSFYALDLTNIKAEFLFVLDDCTDSTKDIITAGMAGFKAYTLDCNVHSCGLARNIGLDYAHGEFIWFVDGDDWLIYPGVLQDVIPQMREKKLNVVRMRYVSNFFNTLHAAMVWQYIYRRSFIGDTRFTAIQPHEDVEFNSKVLDDKVIEIGYNIPVYFYNYLRPGSNISQLVQNGKIEY